MSRLFNDKLQKYLVFKIEDLV